MFCSALALAQQNHTYIYEYDANATPGSTYKADIDGVTIPVVQNSVDVCDPTMGCTHPPTGYYTWTSANSDYSAWSGLQCGSTLRGGTGSACTVNIDFKTVTNGGSNTWTPAYIFRQDWANFAVQQTANQWQSSHLYPIGFTINCGLSGTCSSHYYQAVPGTGGSPAGGVCQSSVTSPNNWSVSGAKSTDNTCTWLDVEISRVNDAPPQDVIFDSDYPGGLPASAGSTTYQATAVIVDGLGDGHYFAEGQNLTACSSGASGNCASLTSGSPSWVLGGYTCDNTCTWHDLGTAIVLNASTTTDTDAELATGMPAVWETPFAYSQQLFYNAALNDFATASQIRYIRTGVGVGEEASIAGAPLFESSLPRLGTLTDAQLKGIWTNQALLTYANNVKTMKSLSSSPNWVMMALINCGTSLSTSPGTDCTWADVEAAGALSYAPYYGGYGTQGLQSSDLYLQQGIAQCQIPFQGKSCCSDNWCETRYYMTGKMPYIELQELCSSYFAAGAPSTSCIYDPSFPNSSLSEVLAIATQHGTNVIELGIPEFECAYGSTCTASYPAAMIANQNAIQNASVGQPSATTAIFGTLDLLGFGNIF